MGEPVLVVGKERFAGIDIRVRVSGGGRIAQIYAIRQAVARAVVAYYQKYVDEQSKQEIKVCSRQRLQSEGPLVPQLERQLLRVRARPKLTVRARPKNFP